MTMTDTTPSEAALALRDHPYARFLHEVQKPAQYVGGEHGQVKKEWDAVQGRLCLAFPDLYEIGMSHLGFKILYGIVNGHEKLLAERAYAVWPDMEAKLREHGETLRSLESGRALRDFDVVGFSLQFELTYSNILQMLELGGIPRWSHERGEDDPLVIAGGPVGTHAEPIAPFIDAILIGDGEAKTAEVLLAWTQLKQAGVPRMQRLRAVAKLGGWYVPALYDTAIDDETGFRVVSGPKPEFADVPFPVMRTIEEDLDKYRFPTTTPVAATETIFDRVSVEIARGCTEGCRFCQAGMIYRPVRERSPEHILETLRESVKFGGYDEASLTSLSTADYSAIQPLVHAVTNEIGKDHQVNVTVSSLRAYGLDEAVLDDMKTQRAGGLTFAPEAGTQLMRDVVNKNVTEEQLMTTAERVFSRGWTKMKLYFMIGLPTEEDEDVEGIIQTAAKTQRLAKRVRGKGGARVTASVSTHVPKPHTPFQWCAMDTHADVVRKQQILRQASREQRVGLKVHDSAGSWLEGILARGDRGLAQVVSDAFDGGARFDSWSDTFELEVWNEALEKNGVETERFLGTIPTTARLPWDHIDVGLEEKFLLREYRKSLKNRLSPPCGKVAGAFVHHTNLAEAEAEKKKLVCYNCGIACDMQAMRDDRLVKLRTLGAEEPRVAPSVIARQEAEARGEDHREHVRQDVERQPLKGVDQGAIRRLRVRFAKVGAITFSSHLDLVRLFPRWFRRANLPMYYSEGYNPRPQMTFAPALTLGAAGLGEVLDLKLRGDELEGEADLLSRLRETAPEGIEVRDVVWLGDQDPSLSKLISEQEWLAGVPREVLHDAGLEDDAFFETVALRREGPLTIIRGVAGKGRKKGGAGIGKKVDLGQSLIDAGPGEAALLAQAGVALENFVPLSFTLRFGEKGSARPREALAGLLGLSLEGLAELPATPLVRVGLFGRHDAERVDLMDLESIRSMRAGARRSAESVAEA